MLFRPTIICLKLCRDTVLPQTNNSSDYWPVGNNVKSATTNLGGFNCFFEYLAIPAVGRECREITQLGHIDSVIIAIAAR
jgi:hypothetical protein